MAVTINGTTGLTFNNSSTTTVGALGDGQTWQTPTRSAGVTYTNTTGKPITVVVNGNVNASNTWYTYIFVDSLRVCYCFGGGGASAYYTIPYTVIVPNGSTYSVTNAGGIDSWFELR